MMLRRRLFATAICMLTHAAAVTDMSATTCTAATCEASYDQVLLQRQVKHDKSLTLDSEVHIMSGDSVFLTAFTGKQITVQHGKVHARWIDRHDWQTFVIEKDGGGHIQTGDQVYLRAHTGNYLTVQGEHVHAYWKNERGAWQQFIIEKADGDGMVKHYDGIFLRAHTGKRVTVMPAGHVGAEVHASWDHQGAWERLTIEKRVVETTSTTTTTTTTTTSTAESCSGAWMQCGGRHWKGPTCCVEGYYCHDEHDYHSICRPAKSGPPAATTTEAPVPSSTKAATTTHAPAPSGTTTGTSTPAPAPSSTKAATTTTASTTTTSPPPTTSSPWVRGTWTTGYWDCCKPSCSWPGKGNVDKPVRMCEAGTGFPLTDLNEPSVCRGGKAASCANNGPWAHSHNLSFGFAAAAVSGNHGLTGDDNCGQCYELRFVGGKHPRGNWGGSHPEIIGKTMIIQVTNIGYDVTGEHSFDLQIPGAGQGAFSSGCTAQFHGFSSGDFDCNNLYGGCHEKTGCDRLPLDLQAGCQWRYDWYHWLKDGGQTNNPFVDFRRVRCPAQIIAVTGSTPLDDEDFPEISVADYE